MLTRRLQLYGTGTIIKQVRLFNAHPTGAMYKSERLECHYGGWWPRRVVVIPKTVLPACPKGIPLTTSIAALNREATMQMFGTILW